MSTFELLAPASKAEPYIPDVLDNRDRPPEQQFCVWISPLTGDEGDEITHAKLNRAARRMRKGGESDEGGMTKAVKEEILKRKVTKIENLTITLQEESGEARKHSPRNGEELVKLIERLPSDVAFQVRESILLGIQQFSKADQGFLLGSDWQRGSQTADGTKPEPSSVPAVGVATGSPDLTGAATLS